MYFINFELVRLLINQLFGHLEPSVLLALTEQLLAVSKIRDSVKLIVPFFKPIN